MAKKKNNYYVVAKGLKPGLYQSWPECQAKVNGFNGAVFKGFFALEDALAYMNEHGVPIPAEYENHKPETPEIDEDTVVIFTDGGAINNPGPGGYGAVLSYKGKKKELSGGFRKTTNNRMEVFACIKALEALKQPCKVVLHSDSKYLINAINEGWIESWRLNGWKRKNTLVDNADLWQQLYPLVHKHDIRFEWVKGHGGKADNERCDQLVKQAARQENLPPDKGYEGPATLF